MYHQSWAQHLLSIAKEDHFRFARDYEPLYSISYTLAQIVQHFGFM